MNAEEIDQDAVTHDEREGTLKMTVLVKYEKLFLCLKYYKYAWLTTEDPIVIEHGTFSWEPETTTLRDINLRIKPGSLVAIVGSVGSGTALIPLFFKCDLGMHFSKFYFYFT